MRSNGRGERRSFVYQRPKAEAIERAASQEGGGFDTIIRSEYQVFKPHDKVNALRFMPATWENADSFAYKLKVHRNVGPDGNSYLCLRMLEQPCPICEERVDLTKHSETEAAKQIRPQDVRAAWVIDRDKESEGPKVWVFGWTMEKNIALLCRDRRSGEILYIDDPDEGYDISFVKEGSGLKTQYRGEQIDRRPSPLHDNEDKQDDWLDYIADNPIPDTLNFYEYDYIRDVLGGGVAPKEKEEPQRIRSRRSVREDTEEDVQPRRSRQQVDEDEPPPPREREPEVEPEEEEEPRPQRNRLRQPDVSEQGRAAVGRLRPPGERGVGQRPSLRDRE